MEPDRPAGAPRPFETLAAEVPRRDALRRAITAATLTPEPDCLPPLIRAAALTPEKAAAARALALRLATALRDKFSGHGVEALIHEYDLSSEEGVALMCLAEALLRIPDPATRDALIRDKIGGGDWRRHLGKSPSLFVNAATWALMLTGQMTATSRETRLSSALARLIGRGGEPLIRAGVDIAMRLLGEQFVAGRTIEEALERGRARERQGFRYSFDMLGEAALTARDAEGYFASYDHAIRAIGRAAHGRGPVEGPGVSIKLSALHPRYCRAQRGRVTAELYPRLLALALLCRRLDVGLNIDAEEADRLELSLDLFERLAFERELDGWAGLGLVVQAYGKRAPFVIDWLADLGRRTRRRLMVRLVKGAYWDSEIKRAQTLGLDDFPVFTRKIHTDVSYLACARKMLEAADALFSQFATHNAATLAAVREMAGARAPQDLYEFQCLHGMGEPLYEEVVGERGLGRPCRIYAPVGQHETLLAYLVRRLLENGANSSFVNRVADKEVRLDDLVADPVEAACRLAPLGRPHEAIAPPREIFGAPRGNLAEKPADFADLRGKFAPPREASRGLDLTDEATLASLAKTMPKAAARGWFAAPLLADGPRRGERRPVANPANPQEIVGFATDADEDAVQAAFGFAQNWAASAAARAQVLERAADLFEARAPAFYGLLVREAGKTLPAAVAEVREAVDFLRYYAAGVRDWTNAHRPLGAVVCISPWNFPLAIFTGQIAAALAAGDAVLAKPAEETPLIAAESVAALREAGVPATALQLLPGGGETGAALVADPRAAGVLFTGSTATARSIQSVLSSRLSPDGGPVPLVAETGGQNVMIVDSSALPEQAVQDIVASAFDSAGQRCSALRALCLQEEIAGRVLAMLKGAVAELGFGDPAKLSTDVGPVISQGASDRIEAYLDAARRRGLRVWSPPERGEPLGGTFVRPAIVEIGSLGQLGDEVFGPVLHVLTFRREALDRLIDDVARLGYGLTFGIHSRIDETVEAVAARRPAGILYVNRDMIGAVVGAQPFGGFGLSGTGPKAGGALYLSRLLSARPPTLLEGAPPHALEVFAQRLEAAGRQDLAGRCRALGRRTPLGARIELPGVVGESNVYELAGRGAILCRARTADALALQIGATLAAGGTAFADAPDAVAAALGGWDCELANFVQRRDDDARIAAALVEDDPDAIRSLLAEMAAREGRVVPVVVVPSRGGDEAVPLDLLVREIVTSVNTAAAGGNASLLALE